jgi:hypothetical protein
MSQDLTGKQAAKNPYQSWAFTDEPYAAERAPPAGYRPGGLTSVCIIAIVLGVLGFLTGSLTLVTQAASNQLQQLQSQWGAAGASPQVRDVQAEMNAKSMAIMNRFRLVNVLLGLAQLGLCAALVIGGVRTLRLNERGRKLLFIACSLAMLFELTRAVPTVLMQLENMALMADYFPRVMEASVPSGQSQQVAEFAKMMTRFSLIMGWVILFGWLSMKLAFYGSSAYYLTRPKTKALFAATKPSPKKG